MKYFFGDKIYGSSQNLNIKRDDNYNIIYRGAMRKHGRAWLNIGRTEFEAVWVFGHRCWGSFIGLDLGGGDSNGQIMIKMALFHLFMIFLSIEDFRLAKLMPGKWVDSYIKPGEKWRMPIERDIGLSYLDGYLRLKLWANPMEWNRSDPWWWEMSVNIPDLIFGRSIYSKENEQTGQAYLLMPERVYEIDYIEFDSVWKFPRFKKPIRLKRFELTPSRPIPIPGKGENSCDIDDDAIYSGVYRAETLNEALDRLKTSIMRNRIRYGGSDWTPVMET